MFGTSNDKDSGAIAVQENPAIKLPNFKKDWLPFSPADGITIMAMTLLALGIVMVYSSSSIRMDLKNDATIFLRRQILWAVLAGIVFIIARSTDVSLLKKYATPIFAACCLLLVAVLTPLGKAVGGARRWISIGGMNIQPSEIAKIAMIIMVAKSIEMRRDKLSYFKEGYLKIIAPILIIVGLVIVEPDFGSAALLIGVGMIMVFVAGAKLKHLAITAVPGVLAVIGLVMLKGDHVRARLAAFFDPNADPNGVNYQPIQAIIALGSGGLFGQGLGASRQKRMFLPEIHTDYIFALVGEELGFIGASGVILLFALLLFFGFAAVLRAKDRFSFFVALGLTLFIGFQTVINISVATGTIPPKGIALPLISFGGSSLCICAASLGILVNIAMAGRRKLPPTAKPTSPDTLSLVNAGEVPNGL